MLATLNNFLAIFASNQEFVLCLTMTHSAMQKRRTTDSGTPPGMNQSALKHGRRTFLYSAIKELVCNGEHWARAALRQLRSRIARAFSRNSLVNTMDTTAAIQYILTAAQSLGSQVHYQKS